MIRVVHPGSRILMLTFFHPGSRIQGSKRYPIPDPGSGSATLLGGQDFEAVFKLSKLTSDEEMRKWSVHMCRHPRNIILRPGMLSSQWTDLVEK
jgi:hypothetical protein